VAYVDLACLRREVLDVDPARAEGGIVGWCYAVWRLVTAECWLRFQEDRDFPARLVASGTLAQARYAWDERFV